jgi:hypothetical protein
VFGFLVQIELNVGIESEEMKGGYEAKCYLLIDFHPTLVLIQTENSTLLLRVMKRREATRQNAIYL